MPKMLFLRNFGSNSLSPWPKLPLPTWEVVSNFLDPPAASKRRPHFSQNQDGSKANSLPTEEQSQATMSDTEVDTGAAVSFLLCALLFLLVVAVGCIARMCRAGCENENRTK